MAEGIVTVVARISTANHEKCKAVKDRLGITWEEYLLDYAKIKNQSVEA